MSLVSDYPSSKAIGPQKTGLSGALILLVTMGSGVAGYFVSRKILGQSKLAAAAQCCTLAASAFGILNSGTMKNELCKVEELGTQPNEKV